MFTKRTSIVCIMLPFLLVLSPSGLAQISVPEKYELPELTELSGTEFGTVNSFRRAFFVDERAFVVQRERNGRYYLLVLESPNFFSGVCARRPQQVRRMGATYFLACGGDRRGIPIVRFYVFESREQMLEVTARLQP